MSRMLHVSTLLFVPQFVCRASSSHCTACSFCRQSFLAPQTAEGQASQRGRAVFTSAVGLGKDCLRGGEFNGVCLPLFCITLVRLCHLCHNIETGLPAANHSMLNILLCHAEHAGLGWAVPDLLSMCCPVQLSCAALCCAVLRCAVLCCAVLCCVKAC